MAVEDDEERAEPEPEELGGEPACLLARVCPECGGVLDTAPPTVCPRCGTFLTRE
jgi:rubrerythrin